MSELNEIHERLARVEGDVATALEDAAVARHLAAETDRDIADVQQTQLAHTRVLNALRETQVHHGQQLTDLQTTQIEQRSELRKLRAAQRDQGRQLTEHGRQLTKQGSLLAEQGRQVEEGFAAVNARFDELAALIKRSGKTA